MPVDSRLHGKTGQVQMDPAGGSTLVTLGDTNSWSLDASTERVDVTAFGDTNKQKRAGLPEYGGNLGMWWNAVAQAGPALLRRNPRRYPGHVAADSQHGGSHGLLSRAR